MRKLGRWTAYKCKVGAVWVDAKVGRGRRREFAEIRGWKAFDGTYIASGLATGFRGSRAIPPGSSAEHISAVVKDAVQSEE